MKRVTPSSRPLSQRGVTARMSPELSRRRSPPTESEYADCPRLPYATRADIRNSHRSTGSAKPAMTAGNPPAEGPSTRGKSADGPHRWVDVVKPTSMLKPSTVSDDEPGSSRE